MSENHKIGVVIPCYRVGEQVLDLIGRIGPEVNHIYVVDDFCPEHTGDLVEKRYRNDRVTVIRHPENQGVGGAVMSGYVSALKDGMEIIVKLDGDGQMNPSLIPQLVAPIVMGEADYAKGNRFFNLEDVRAMPLARLLGNVILSFITKLSSGYWDLFDPTNGFTAIHCDVARDLPFQKISRRYFFESDMLFQLNTLRAVVVDVPMEAKYADESSNLRISGVVGEFAYKNSRNFIKRLFYNYYLRDMSLASVELPLGLLLLAFGVAYGGYHWTLSARTGITASAGTVMLAALPVLAGLQLVLAFIGYDVASVPRRPRHARQPRTIGR